MDLIIPEIFANAVNEKLDTSLRVGRLAFDATSSVSEILNYGMEINFPQINRVATATNVTKGTPLTPATIDMTNSKAIVQWVNSSFRVYDDEVQQIKSRVMDNIVEQVATAMAKRLDSDLVGAMDTDVIYKSPCTSPDSITVSELRDAMSLFQDDIDTDSFAGILINSRLVGSFMSLPEFTSTNFTYQQGNNGIVSDGVIGKYMGIDVVVGNNNTYDSVAKECKTYILKKNSLGFIFARNIKVEEQRELATLSTLIAASSFYATKLLDAKNCVILRKTVA